jgi:hypothetical protein
VRDLSRDDCCGSGEKINYKEEIPMRKTTCVILGLAFLVLGILGIIGLVPMFKTDPIYVNIGEIVLGALGLVVGVYDRKSVVNYPQRTETSQQGKEIDQQRKDINQQRKEIDQQREDIDQQKAEKIEQSEEKIVL